MSSFPGKFTLDPNGAVVEAIADFTRNEDGTWEACEKCDYYFFRSFTNDQVKEFAKHLLAVCEEKRGES